MKLRYLLPVLLLFPVAEVAFSYEVNTSDSLFSTKEEFNKILQDIGAESYKNKEEIDQKLAAMEEKIHALQFSIKKIEDTHKKILTKIDNVSEDMRYRFAKLEKPSSKDSLKNIGDYVSMIGDGRIKEARKGLFDYIKYKKGNIKGEAYYWLGKSYMEEESYGDAGTYFLKSYKYYPSNEKAPESLLGLAVSLKQLDKKNRACSILDRLGSEYPNRPNEFKEIYDKERSLLKCD